MLGVLVEVRQTVHDQKDYRAENLAGCPDH